MHSRRVKFTVLGLMLAIAVVALLLALAARMHTQPVRIGILNLERGTIESAREPGTSRIPHPTAEFEITWSDGSKTTVGWDGPIPRCHGGEPFAFGFLRRVEWYDGTWERRTGDTWPTS